MTGMFKDVQVGDRVYDILLGWGKVERVDPGRFKPIGVHFSNPSCTCWYYSDGRHDQFDLIPRLYWDEVAAPEPPSKPIPVLPVDTPILVSNGREEFPAHFHSRTSHGAACVFSYGRTSHTASRDSEGLPDLTNWLYWRLPEDTD